jgi:gas vesicle protein
MSKNTSKFFLAGLLGAIAGAVGGVLFAPKSGEETREDIVKLANKLVKAIKTEVEDTEDRVTEVFGEATKVAKDKYKEITSKVMEKVAAVKSAGEEINKEKYSMIVEDVISEFKNDFDATKNGATKLANQLKKDWQKVKKALMA